MTSGTAVGDVLPSELGRNDDRKQRMFGVVLRAEVLGSPLDAGVDLLHVWLLLITNVMSDTNHLH